MLARLKLLISASFLALILYWSDHVLCSVSTQMRKLEKRWAKRIQEANKLFKSWKKVSDG